MPYLMGSTSWSATSHEDAHFPDAIEASTPSANPCGAEVGREGQAHQCEAPPTPTAIFKTDWKGHGTEPSASHLSVDASRPTSQTSVITSRSIADIIDQLDQGLVRAVEFYDSCKTLVVAMADGQTQAVASIPQDSLSQVLAKLRVNKVRMKSYFNKKFELPVQPGNVENSTPASPGGVNSAGNPADDADCLFLEQRLELCLKPMQDNFANMEPCENREDVLNDIVEAGISAIQAAMTSDRSRDLMKVYESRVRSLVRRHISSIMP